MPSELGSLEEGPIKPGLIYPRRAPGWVGLELHRPPPAVHERLVLVPPQRGTPEAELASQ